MSELTNLLFTEKYRPSSFDDIVCVNKNVILEHLKTPSKLPSFIFSSCSPGCQPKGEKVLLSNGKWENIENIKIGDEVFSPQKDNSVIVSKVIFTKRYISNIYSIIMHEYGNPRILFPIKYRVAEEHLLYGVCEYCKNTSTFFPNELSKSGCKQIRGVYSPLINFPAQTLPIPPYFLGILLGDGCFSGKGSISITTIDNEIINEIYKFANEFNLNVKKRKISYCLIRPLENKFFNIIAKKLRLLGLMGKKSGEKFIPDIYKYSDISQRLELLAGLLDADGNKAGDENNPNFYYTTKSYKLAKDIYYICKSLGFGCSIRTKRKSWVYKNIKKYGIYFGLSISTQDLIIPTKIKRKKQLVLRNKKWKNIRYRGLKIIKENYQEEVYGFTLDSPSGLYITNNFIITHNTGKTSMAKIIAKYLDCDTSFLNAADERGIDTIRVIIKEFAQNLSSKEGIKRMVFLDEVDGLTSQAFECLKSPMETYSDNVFFILSCNNINRIIPAIRSRCVVISFDNPPRKDIFERLEYINEQENLKIDVEDLKKLIEQNYPDIRSMILAMQSGISINVEYETFYKAMICKDIDYIYIKTYSGSFNIMEFNDWMFKHLYDNYKLFSFTQLVEISLLLADTEKAWNLSSKLPIIFLANIVKIVDLL